jgi:hypothetical protein
MSRGVFDPSEMRDDVLRHLLVEGIAVDGEVDPGTGLEAIEPGAIDRVQGVGRALVSPEVVRGLAVGLVDREAPQPVLGDRAELAELNLLVEPDADVTEVPPDHLVPVRPCR